MNPATLSEAKQEIEHAKWLMKDQDTLQRDILNFLCEAQRTLGSRGNQNPTGPYKRSLIHYAALADATELISYLSRCGASIDEPDQNRRTPLSWAAEFGACNTAIILLKKGAKVNPLDDFHSTPLSWSINCGDENRKRMQAILRRYGGRVEENRRGWIVDKLKTLYYIVTTRV